MSCFPLPYDLIYPNYCVKQFRLCAPAHSSSKCHTRFCRCVSHPRRVKRFVSSTAHIMTFMHADHLCYTPYVNAGSRVARAKSYIMVAHKLYYLMGTPMCETFRGSSVYVHGVCIVVHNSPCKHIRLSTGKAVCSSIS